MCVHTCVSVWRSEVGFDCLPLLFLLYSGRRGLLLLSLGVGVFASQGRGGGGVVGVWPTSPRDQLVSAFPHYSYR